MPRKEIFSVSILLLSGGFQKLKKKLSTQGNVDIVLMGFSFAKHIIFEIVEVKREGKGEHCQIKVGVNASHLRTVDNI